MQSLSWLSIFCFCCAGAFAAPTSSTWSLAEDQHFQIYSQAGPETARSALRRFEQLRTLFTQNGFIETAVESPGRPPVRVIGFRSEKEYDAFRLRATADAFYVGSEHQDYIVMPALTQRVFSLAAHEYAHLVLHSSGAQLPPWLNEGLAEFFSTIRITDVDSELGAGLPMRIDTLRRHPWIPLPQLVDIEQKSLATKSRDEIAIFYAESWALAHMLMLSPDYSPQFRRLMTALNSGDASLDALTTIYARPIETIAKDLQAWSGQHELPNVTLPVRVAPEPAARVSGLSEAQATELMAGILLISGELDRAEALYRHLALQSPGNANVLAALASIALRRGDRAAAEQCWKEAMDKGVTDAGLLYRYAVVAEGQGLSQSEIRRTLERAVALEPGFDDARYKLGLLENNVGDYQAALIQLRAMRNPSAQRAFGYWSATANALTELGQRDEASNAARKALDFAQTASERALALQLDYVAKTDLTVQFAEDANGNERLITTRVPHGDSGFNPFIDPKDHIQRVEGTLREVRCSNGQLTGFLISTPDNLLSVAVPDPMHVLIRNGPVEFTCGPQPSRRVRIEYAVAVNPSRTQNGVLRGLELIN